MKKLLLLTGILLYCLTSFAQVNLSYYLPDSVTYNPDIPTPQSVLGFEIGDWHLSHLHLVRYLEKLDEASDRITLEVQGHTFEQRPTLLLTITSPDNHQNIDQIREDHVQLTDPDKSDDLNTDEMPAVVWLGYSIHGNER